MSATVFLGGGRITAALVAGLRAASFRGRIVVHDRNPEKLRVLARHYGAHPESSLDRAVAQAGTLLIAVRPPEVVPLVRGMGVPPRGALCVSLAAGVSLRSLRRASPLKMRWARAMPSPACRNGHGLTALAFDSGFPRPGRSSVRKLFARVGAVLEIPEAEFDAFTVVYSTSQGYHALGARVRAARKVGLSSRTAFLAVAHSLAEAVRSLEGNPASLDKFRAEAATPGGVAAEVIRVLRAGGYDRLVERAVRAGVARARRLGNR